MESLKILWKKIKDGSIREMWEEWKWIYAYGRQYKREIVLYILLGMIGTVMNLAGSVASKNLIDIVTGVQKNRILPMAVLMVVMAVCAILFQAATSRISARISIKILNDVQADIYEKLMRVNWLDLSQYASGDILNRFVNDATTVAGSAIGWFPTLLTSSFSFFASLAVILYYDPTMAFIALLNAPAMLIVSRFLLGRLRRQTGEVKKTNSDIMAFEQETFYNIDSIKSFDLSGLFGERLHDWQQKFRQVNLDYNMLSVKTKVALSVIGTLIQYMGYGWGVYRLWSGHITYGEMMLFLEQAGKLSSNFHSMVSIVPNTIGATASAGRLMEILNLPPEEKEEEISEELEKMASKGFQIELQNVCFAYKQGRNVLADSYFSAAPGEIVALVGPSGEGKTTMIRLFLGLIVPQSGSALLRDAEGKEVHLNASTRRFFSYVPQGNSLFSGTIEENLRMVKEDATQEEMIDALQAACAWDFVRKMPDGIKSSVGEKGRGLSEGQAQRIAIARAVLREAPVLLLDEATSALDVATERKVLKNIIKSRPDRTCIVTTHRPSVLSMCQRVYRVMDTKTVELSREESARMAMDF